MCPKMVVIECLLLFCDIDFPIGGLEPSILFSFAVYPFAHGTEFL